MPVEALTEPAPTAEHSSAGQETWLPIRKVLLTLSRTAPGGALLGIIDQRPG